MLIKGDVFVADDSSLGEDPPYRADSQRHLDTPAHPVGSSDSNDAGGRSGAGSSARPDAVGIGGVPDGAAQLLTPAVRFGFLWNQQAPAYPDAWTGRAHCLGKLVHPHQGYVGPGISRCDRFLRVVVTDRPVLRVHRVDN